MAQKFKKIFIYNLIAIIIAFQVVLLLNYWFFIYNNIVKASINQTIVYQGKVVDVNSVAIDDGSYKMRFRIYDELNSGNLLWMESWDGVTDQDSVTLGTQASLVTITNGLFTVDLNSLCGNWTGNCASSGGVDFNTAQLYLEVTLDANGITGDGAYLDGYEEVFTPRKRFSSIAYAMNSDKVDGNDIVSDGGKIPLLDYNNIWSGVNTVQIASATNKGFIFKAASSQSANLTEFQNNAGTVISAFNSSGYLETTNIITNKITSTTTSVGAAPSLDYPVTMIVYSKFDEGTGANASDETANSYNGTLVGTPTWNSTGSYNYSGDSSITLNGTSQYIDYSTHASSLKTATGSIALWFKADVTTGAIEALYGAGALTTNWFSIVLGNVTGAYSDESLGVLVRSGGVDKLVAYVRHGHDYYFDGVWHFLVVTQGGSGLKIYVDGVAESLTFQVGTSSTSNWTDITTSTSAFIGKRVYTGSPLYFSGVIDNFLMYNSALTAEHVVNLYNSSIDTGNGLVLDTGAPYIGENLLSIKNNGTTVASFNENGVLTTSGITSTGQILSSPSTNTVPIVIQSSASQTSNLTEWKNYGGTILSLVDVSGNLIVSNVTANQVITKQVVSTATYIPSIPSVSDPNIVSYWKMDDGSGTLAVDSVGNNNGTISNATWTGSGAFGYSGDNSLTFNGTVDYVTITDNSTLDLTNNYSISVLYKTNSTVRGGILDKLKSTSPNEGFSLSNSQNGDGKFSFFSATSGWVYSTANLADGNWHNVVITSSGNSGIMYVDGVEDVNFISSNLEVNAINLKIGIDYLDNYFNGIIDNIIIYNDVRNAFEIANDYSDFIGSAVGAIFDTQNSFSSSNAKLASFRNNLVEKMYFKVDGIGFSGDANKSLLIDRTATANTNGYNLTVSAGGATLDATDKKGGDLYLISGISTGNASSDIILQASGGGTTGTLDKALITRLIVAGDGSIQIGDVVSGGELRFYEGSNYVGFKANSNLTSNQIWELPATDGAIGQTLTTNSSGILSWSNRGEMTRTVVAVNTYQILTTDVYLGVTYTSTNAVTLTLPTPISNHVIIIKDEGASASTNNITINQNSSETIDGQTSVIINTNYGSLRLYSDGTNWYSF